MLVVMTVETWLDPFRLTDVRRWYSLMDWVGITWDNVVGVLSCCSSDVQFEITPDNHLVAYNRDSIDQYLGMKLVLDYNGFTESQKSFFSNSDLQSWDDIVNWWTPSYGWNVFYRRGE